MIREFCDICGKEIVSISSGEGYQTTRYQVIVNGGPRKEDMMNISEDILCKDCMRKGHLVQAEEEELETEVQAEIKSSVKS